MRWLLLVAFAACSFSARAVPRDDASDAPALDAALDGTPDAPRDAAAAFCDQSDATLIACYEFEGTTADGGPHQLDATMTGVTFAAGKLGMAAHFGGAAAANVAENPALDPTSLTIEAWIKAPLPPPGGRAGIVDNESQWGFFLHEQGQLQCITGANAAVSVPADTWTHVACTYDGVQRVLYVNGTPADIAPVSGPLGAGGSTGISIGANNPPGGGSPLNGDMDQLRIFNVARTPQQICEAAGCQF